MQLRIRLPQRCANSIAYGGDRKLDKPVAFLHDDRHRFRIDHPLFSAKTNRRFPPVALPRLDTSTISFHRA